MKPIIYFLLPLILLGCKSTQPTTEVPKPPKTLAKTVSEMQAFSGYFDYYWEEKTGKIWLVVDKWDEEFLYLNALTTGVGSNDIGLDRGKVRNSRVVKFIRSGRKALLIQPNYDYRAKSDNPDERRSVEEAFAQSVIAGFPIKIWENGKALIDLSPVLMKDEFGVIETLKRTDQGAYQVDEDRSAIWQEGCKNFPQNSVWESLLTFSGEPAGEYIWEVTPTANAISVRIRHNFIQLPDDRYSPRKFDPRSGYYPISYQDYASPIGDPLTKRFITRHRLEKKDPNASYSEAVEPLVYYVDRGAPEPIRSALVEGASWWNEAFEAAGFINAFNVEVLPEGADPLDIRYNVIQWVHRRTRGWSYGHSIIDPRTGEIIKGHVSLGSLRVRQDYLIAQGLIRPFVTGKPASPIMEKLALMRLRQLSAHEVGHTLGLAHNFAASVNDRASVMDYPHPLITQRADQSLSFDKAYDVGIGKWDIQSIIFGYRSFPNETLAFDSLQSFLSASPLHYISDVDSRPFGGAHPLAHLWDNGTDATKELYRILKVREKSLKDFGEENIREGQPLSELEAVLVPLYYAHRYQVEAVAKVLGGMHYAYAVRDGGNYQNILVEANIQRKALAALDYSLAPKVLALPESILELVPPAAMGYEPGREYFKKQTQVGLDPLTIAEGAAHHTLALTLHPKRANRLVAFHARNPEMPGLQEVIQTLVAGAWSFSDNDSPYELQIRFAVGSALITHLMALSQDSSSGNQAKAIAWQALTSMKTDMASSLSQRQTPDHKAHYQYHHDLLSRFLDDPADIDLPKPVEMPPGSPIGCGWQY